MTMTVPEDMPGTDEILRVAEVTALYRLYDRTGKLWYVGVSCNPFNRIDDGHAFKRWFPVITDIHLEWFPSRDDAEAAELIAIRKERPVLNIAGAYPDPFSWKRAKIPHRRKIDLPANAELVGEAVQAGAQDEFITIKESCELGIAKRGYQATRRRASRDPKHPRPAGRRGKDNLYAAIDLADYWAGVTA